MAYYLQMNGTSDYLYTPSITIDRVVIDCSIDSSSTNSNLYVFSPNGGTYVDATAMNTAFSYVTKSNMTMFKNSLASMKFDGGASVTSKVIVSNQRYSIDYGFNAINDPATEFFTNNARVSSAMTKGIIYRITGYYLGSTVFDYDMTLGNVLDQSGNGKNGTLVGGTFVSDATGTTYSGGGTASGVGSASSTEVQIYAGTGTTSGMAFASSSETVIAASTTYSGNGTASGTSSASSTETVTFASSGTAQGSASVVGNVAVPTTYTDSGTASGIASASSTETLISSRGTPLNRTYVFLDAARLNPIQVDTNLKVVFDYLNSFVVGIGNIVTAASTSFPVTGLSQTNTQYLVTVIPSWNTTYWITGKTTSGFTINFGTAPASDSTLDWRLMR